MMRRPARLYTQVAGVFLLLQGTSTLAFRLIPALDRAFPALLATTHMIPPHSLLHILSGIWAVLLLRRSGESATLWFAAGFGAFYVALGWVGTVIGHPTVLGLQSFDHFFHFLLGGAGLLAAGLELILRHGSKEGTP